MGSPRAWFTVAAGLYVAVWAWSWTRLPERVPVHFGAGGEPDDWSSRGAALLTTGLLGLGTALLFVGCVRLVRRTRGEWLNVPNPRYWKHPENLARLRELAAGDLWLFGAWTVLLLAGVDWLIVRAATAEDPGLGWWPLALVAGYLAGVVGRTVWMYRRRYAVPEDG
ncbi:DUF1648 domain-containing protein [Blastococcus xanthinilyticus]|uniref:Uncharacterized protein DUF1648 n=1 Tax=Blastococcus xanthinilyticus TaxID=1564164 RepID=A0A5S5CR91_9ACTN|nr:DUF1648 domain-containing protein [Blastococcus xanthinilyticus]TYP86125.1 uncharacterized protein DUF1648 [Blastococcus xanthinilyticus]